MPSLRQSELSVSYGSIENDETTPLTQNGPVEGNKRKCGIPSTRILISAAAVLLVAAAILLSGPSVSSHPTNGSTISASSGNENEKKSNSMSLVSPLDLGLMATERAKDASPSEIWGNRTGPLPTNSWYLNLVSHRAAYQPDESTRVYTVPYIVDTAAAAAGTNLTGIRVHWPVLSANDRNIQMVDDFKNGITLGATQEQISKKYTVQQGDLSHLGIGLEWKSSQGDKKKMKTHLVRGMPFATMEYQHGVLPSLYSYNGPASDMLVDGAESVKCGVRPESNANRNLNQTASTKVQKEVQLHFINSDFTWGLFFSRPVKIRCSTSKGDEQIRDFALNVVSYNDTKEPLTVRLALLNQCTTGESDIKGHCNTKGADTYDQKRYAELLQNSVHVAPSRPSIDFSYPSNAQETNAKILIDWGAKLISSNNADESSNDDTQDKDDLLMFALPHHQDILKDAQITDQCFQTFHGNTCLVRGSTWTLMEDMNPGVSFVAPRPPQASMIKPLAQAVNEDIHYQLSDNMMRGAADTYFSGKILARVARVIVIADELRKLASCPTNELQDVYSDMSFDKDNLSLVREAASSVELPSDEVIHNAVEQLKHGVEIWLTGAEAPYIYDKSWGGFVNCGCRYKGKGDKGVCENSFPDCPALESVNEDFGNGYYNDHHYHYGYHVYAAAVVSKFDPEWGEQIFNRVLLYVRDMANPLSDDKFFTQFRQKDWFLGSSWASGIVSAENSPHGRNEESSSEAIAAYEAVALYGKVMEDIFTKKSSSAVETARLIRASGQLLTSTELRATNRYWHVWSSENHVNTYPAAYKQPVVGMLYETMASFQTWFAPYAVVSYGIQLMPFTPVAETRDDPEWASTLYPLYQQSCADAGDFCVENGWSILQAGLCAAAGNPEEALEQAMSISPKVFDSLGGVGNSLTNTIWYIATRKAVNA